MGYRIAAVAAVLLATAVCAVRVGNAQHLDLPVEHAFGGGPFSRAGRLSGDLDSEVRAIMLPLAATRQPLLRCFCVGSPSRGVTVSQQNVCDLSSG